MRLKNEKHPELRRDIRLLMEVLKSGQESVVIEDQVGVIRLACSERSA